MYMNIYHIFTGMLINTQVLH